MARLDSESMAEWRVRQKILLAGVQEDPLCVEKWHALLDAEEQHCQGGADESLLRLYRQATRVLSCDGNVDNELYLRIWIGYAKQQMKVNVEDALETFRFLESRNIGDHYALRFKEWAKLELHAGYRTKALQVLKKGLTLRAMPVSELHRQFLDIYSAEKTKGGTPVRGKGAPNPSTGEVETGEGRLQVAEVGNQSSQSASVASPVAPAVNSNTGGSDTSSSCETQDAVHDMPQPCSDSPTEGANVHSGTITSHARKFPKRLKPLGPPLRVARGDPEVPNESAVPGEPAPSFIYGSVEPSKDHQFFSPPLASNLESQKRVSNGAAVEPESIGDLRKRKAESPPSQGDTSQLVSGLTNAEERYPTCSSPATKDDVGHSQMSWVVNNSSSAVKETSSWLNQGAILDEVNKPTSVADVKEIEQFNVNALHERFLSFRKQQGVTGGSPMKDGNLSNARQSQQLDTSRATQEYLGTGRPTNHTSEGTVKENVAAGCAEVDVLSHSLGSIALLDKDGNGEDHNRQLHVEDLNTAPTSGVAGPSPLAGPVVTSDGEQQFQKLIPSPGHRVQNRQKPRVSSHNSSELKVFRDKAFVENGNSQPRHTSADSHGVVNASTRQPLRDRNLNKPEGKVVAAQQPPRKAQENEAFVVVNNKRYQKLGKIGSGGSSEVFKVIDADCSIFALKRIHLRGKDHTSACGFYQEIEYLERLHGKRHIIRLVDYEVTNKKVLDGSGSIGDRIKEDGTIYMVLEYGEIDLAGMLAEKRKESKEILDENWLRLYWQHVLEAVETIHDERIVHSDLKPANFLMVKGELKLIDFGIAKAIQSDTTNIVRDNQMGTVNYMSPEALLQNTVTDDGELVKVGRASDIWSLGCILYQMVYGQTPFSHLSFYAKIKEITNPNQRINYPPVSNFWLLDAMKKCLCWDPHKRLRIPELLVHPFLRPDLAPQGPIPRGLNGCEIHPEELEQLVLQVQNLPLTSVTQFKSQVLGLLYAKLAGRSDC